MKFFTFFVYFAKISVKLLLFFFISVKFIIFVNGFIQKLIS